jgi:DNA topoisomerase-1
LVAYAVSAEAATSQADIAEAKQAAKDAKLHYVTDRKPGITRRQGKGGTVFHLPSGARITDEAEIARIRKLAVPPAYRDVWICADPKGHLQATGRDARGRKQYRYHPQWRAVRDESKYHRMLQFGRVLPKIRAQIDRDLSLPNLSRSRVLAAVVRLLEKTLARVGNEEYARDNKSFGLTTLRTRHSRVKGSRIMFDFRGKHGIEHHLDLKDRRLATIVQRCRDLPGQMLFQFIGEDGERHAIGSEDVNDYLRDISGEDVTAKDFRTWAATNLAAMALRELERFDSEAKNKKNVVQAVEAVAGLLGNTPSVCRKCYIHPAIFDGYLDGSLLEGLKQRADAVLDEAKSGLTAEEVAVTAFLSRRLGDAIDEPGKAA